MNKYNAQKVPTSEGVYDSVLEYDVAQILYAHIDRKFIHRQHQVVVINRSEYFNPVVMKADFYVDIWKPKQQFYIEAKGFVTTDWFLKYKLLWATHPSAARKFFIVCPPGKQIAFIRRFKAVEQIISFSAFSEFLKEYVR